MKTHTVFLALLVASCAVYTAQASPVNTTYHLDSPATITQVIPRGLFGRLIGLKPREKILGTNVQQLDIVQPDENAPMPKITFEEQDGKTVNFQLTKSNDVDLTDFRTVEDDEPVTEPITTKSAKVDIPEGKGKEIKIDAPAGETVDVTVPAGKMVDIEVPAGKKVDIEVPAGQVVEVEAPAGKTVNVEVEDAFKPHAEQVEVESPSEIEVETSAPATVEVNAGSEQPASLRAAAEERPTFSANNEGVEVKVEEYDRTNDARAMFDKLRTNPKEWLPALKRQAVGEDLPAYNETQRPSSPKPTVEDATEDDETLETVSPAQARDQERLHQKIENDGNEDIEHRSLHLREKAGKPVRYFEHLDDRPKVPEWVWVVVAAVGGLAVLGSTILYFRRRRSFEHGRVMDKTQVPIQRLTTPIVVV